MRRLQYEPKTIGSFYQNHRSNMPPDSAFTYGLINIGGTAVLEGPNGIRKVTRGDIVPSVGKIDSIVRWGNRWIVATDKGLISTR